MSDKGGSHKRTRKARTSRSSQDSLAVQSGHSYEGMPGNNSTTSSRATSNGSYGNQSQSPALQDYVRRPQREDPWTPENASHAYSQRPDGTYNSPYNSSPGNCQYNNSYSSSPVYDPYNNQYNNPYNNNPYNNDPYNNPYNSPYNNPYNDNPYTNDTYTNNPANGSSDVPSYANRNGRIANGDSNNSRSNNTYGSNYDTAYGRSSNSENNQNNTSNNRSRNNSRR